MATLLFIVAVLYDLSITFAYQGPYITEYDPRREFGDWFSKSLTPSDIAALRKASQSLAEHPLTAGVMYYLKIDQPTLYGKFVKAQQEYQTVYKQLTVADAREFLLLYSYTYEFFAYLYARGYEGEHFGYPYQPLDIQLAANFLLKRYAQLSADGRKQVDQVLPKIVAGVKKLAVDGERLGEEEIVKLLDDKFVKSLDDGLDGQEIYDIGSYIREHLPRQPILEEIKAKIRKSQPQLFNKLRKAQEAYAKVLEGASDKFYAVEEFIREYAFTYEALAFISLRYPSLLKEDDYKAIAIGMYLKYDNIDAETKRAIKEKVPEVVHLLEKHGEFIGRK